MTDIFELLKGKESEKQSVIVQGITGKFGTRHTKLMLEYGTNIVAGVTPGKGGQKFEDSVPIYETVKEAVDTGFNSVMFDGSQLPISENIAAIRDIVSYAHPKGVSVEAEVGSVPYSSGRDHIKSTITEVSEALAMEEQGQPDALAISIGNVHRLESGSVAIDLVRYNELEKALSLPLVIHGTSGLEDKDIQMLALRQVAKFNVGTILRKSFGNSLRTTLESDPDFFDRITIMQKVIPDLRATATQVIHLLGQ